MDHGMKETFKRKNSCLPRGTQEACAVIRLVNLPVELEVSQNLGSISANFVLEKNSFTCSISMTNTCKY